MTRNIRVRPLSPAALAMTLAALVAGWGWSPLVALQDPTGDRLWTDSEFGAPQDIDWSDEIPAHIAVVDGAATFDRDGRVEPAQENTPLIAGDRLRTGRGRVQILLADGGSLALDEDTAVELVDDALTRVDAGRIKLLVARTSRAAAYRVDTAGTTIWIRAAGEYRITTDDRRAAPAVHLLVARGMAEIASPRGRTLVRAGYEASASEDATPTAPYAVTVAGFDSFDAWIDRQDTERQGLSASTYLPDELATYNGTFDRYGAWQYEPTYGYVWYPHVAAGWQPYSYGRWSVVGSFGWTWIGYDRWAWPTHHYGRWGYKGARWYWIPAPHWAPAWVSWASAPGYVGWSPLGYDNRPAFAINVGYSSGWHGWNLAPARAFTSTVVVASRSVIIPAGPVVHFTERHMPPARPVPFRGAPQVRGTSQPAAGSRPTAMPRSGQTTRGDVGPGRPSSGQQGDNRRSPNPGVAPSPVDRGELLTNRRPPAAPPAANTPARGRLAGPVIDWPDQPAANSNSRIAGREPIAPTSPRGAPQPQVGSIQSDRSTGGTARSRVVAPSGPPPAGASTEDRSIGSRNPSRGGREVSAPSPPPPQERGSAPPPTSRGASGRTSEAPAPAAPAPSAPAAGSPAGGRAQPRRR